MAKLTLLQLVQDALNATDSEEVSTIEESTDSSMMVNICNRSYEEMMSKHKWRHLRGYSVLEGSTNLSDLDLPSNTVSFDPAHLWYGTNGNESRVDWLEPSTFLELTIKRNTDESNIELIDGIKIYNDRDPIWFTSDNDETLRFDAMPNGSGLVGGNCKAIIWRYAASRLSDDADVYDLPEIAFPVLSNLIIAKALNELKGDTQGSSLELRTFTKGMGSLARNARVIDKPTDILRHIVPRRTNIRSTPRIAQ